MLTRQARYRRSPLGPQDWAIRMLIRIANLPPEMPNDIIKEYMTKYGIVNGVTDEKWSNMYRYAVGNGIRIATIDLRMHIPSHLYIACGGWCRILV